MRSHHNSATSAPIPVPTIALDLVRLCILVFTYASPSVPPVLFPFDSLFPFNMLLTRHV